MKSSTRIYVLAAVALAIPIVVSPVLTRAYGSPFSVPTISFGILAGLIPGALVWVGTYVGARWAASQQRTVRLAQVLAILYFIVGIVLTLPIKTHAVLLEMPAASGSAGPLDFVSPLAFSVGAPLVMVVAPMLLTRGIAILCGRKTRRDA